MTFGMARSCSRRIETNINMPDIYITAILTTAVAVVIFGSLTQVCKFRN
jgi:Na+/alanine symporter